MPIDIREEAARYYDYERDWLQDIPFYEQHIPSPDACILELGCGTGRVLVPLAPSCAYIHGVDISEPMLDICRRKLGAAGIPPSKALVESGDICCIDLGRRFDLIIAPFRVFQNLETDEEVDGFFDVVRRHLAPGGTCILNVFKPKWDAEGLKQYWLSKEDRCQWETEIEGGRVTCHARQQRMDEETLVLYPELVYRRYECDTLVDETVLKIPMRCYYADDFTQLVEAHGFDILDRWGGYAGEPYGDGPELVLQFVDAGS
jgi:SAM-dependent methyltransferase